MYASVVKLLFKLHNYLTPKLTHPVIKMTKYDNRWVSIADKETGLAVNKLTLFLFHKLFKPFFLLDGGLSTRVFTRHTDPHTHTHTHTHAHTLHLHPHTPSHAYTDSRHTHNAQECKGMFSHLSKVLTQLSPPTPPTLLLHTSFPLLIPPIPPPVNSSVG